MAKMKLKLPQKDFKYYVQSAFSRKITIVVLLALQLLLFVLLYFRTVSSFAAMYAVQTVLAGVIAVLIVNSNDHPSYKIAWLVPMVILPGFMSLAYIYLHAQINRVRFTKRINIVNKQTKRYMPQEQSVLDELREEDHYSASLSSYINKYAGYPVYKNTDAEYFKIGEELYARLIEELKAARHYILMEFFIIDEGEVWRTILRILLEKANAGVEVRLMYDGMGSASILPWGHDKFLNDNGIKCKVFNKFRPFLASEQNNRDHRKIVVIDGTTAFTGGINLADEYINKKVRFGHWKDSGVMLKGDAVWNFAIMFFQMWELDERDCEDYNRYRPHKVYLASENGGFVQPYGDCPNDAETVGKTVYLDMISKAKDYIYITAPYFVIDNELVTALAFAAKSGVDVKIIVPGIYDKWYVHQMSMCYYRELLPCGVKFYSYTPGFVHAKNFVSDDKKAVVGTINTDFRSLYLHFEDAVFMYDSPAVSDVKADFLTTLKSCKELTLKDVNKNIFSRLLGSIIKVFGPLL